ncbi:TetR family transcriptional regulator [Actinoallomurus purpureus]|uniref:TetR family transcriptional regulator n=1 Tax=Actinoallomurus purpureus TaxID=478114 RepID=UPI002092D694|nr:TetR family transcriptional regulator [Actinoallomurus purpureus]MCO6009062.1 TetR family transcriptional regulator [Actinoallomurus purpureus]
MATTEERARLSRETVVDGALALADEEGLDGLTIRRLAQRLGVTPMALYWHFKNKDELHNALVDRMWSLVDTKVDPAAPWFDRLRALMESVVHVLHAHPSAAQLMMTTHLDAAPRCFDSMEAALALLAEAGFEPRRAAAICRYGLRTAVTLAIADPEINPKMSCQEVTELRRHKRITLETLPPDRYAHVVDAASALSFGEDSDPYVALGIDLFVAGVRALAPNG